MHYVGKAFIAVLWTVFGIAWLIFGMGPPAIALVGYLSGENVPGDALFLMTLYALAMILLLIATLAWTHNNPVN